MKSGSSATNTGTSSYYLNSNFVRLAPFQGCSECGKEERNALMKDLTP
jgi:hypothetical protein